MWPMRGGLGDYFSKAEWENPVWATSPSRARVMQMVMVIHGRPGQSAPALSGQWSCVASSGTMSIPGYPALPLDGGRRWFVDGDAAEVARR